MRFLLALTLFLTCLASVFAQTRDPTPQEVASWHRVSATYPDACKKDTPSYSFLVAEISDVAKSDPSFFQQANWPEVLAVRYATQLQALKGASVQATPRPLPGNVVPAAQFGSLTNNEILFDAYPGDSTHHVLTVTNGGNSDAIVKVVDPLAQKKILSFAVSANSTASITGIPEGGFFLYFAFGDRVYQSFDGKNTDHFAKPQGFSRMDKRLDFQTTQDSESTYTAEHTVTITPVPGGNVTTTAVSKADFEQW